MTREALLVVHAGKPASAAHARTVARDLAEAGFRVRALAKEVAELKVDGLSAVAKADAADGVEIVIALGGDGTLLRAAELARPVKAPLLGINLGHVGFLAEAEIGDLDQAIRDVVRGAYTVDERLTLDVVVTHDGATVGRGWALNEISLEKSKPAKMLEVLVEIDGRPLSRYGCDGVLCATPTGSTAYALSAGGPVVWPEVEALLVVPVSAHALFSRPLVTSPTSTVTFSLEPRRTPAMLACDGRRLIEVPAGGRATITRGDLPVRVVRLQPRPFTDRLVAKFGLPVEGWRRNGSGGQTDSGS